MRALAAALSVLTLVAAVAAQTRSPAATPPRTPVITPQTRPPAEMPKPLTPADDTVRQLLVDFNRLFESLRNAGGVKEGNLELLRSFDGRVEAALATRPDDRQLLAMRIQLATWMKDDAAMDEGFRRLIAVTDGDQAYIDAWVGTYRRVNDNEKVAAIYQELVAEYPDNIPVRLAWAEELVRQARFGQALDILEQTEFDPAEHPRAVLSLAESLMAENRFEDVAAVLDRIPEDVLGSDASVKARSDLLRRQAETYVEAWPKEQEIRSAEARADDLPRIEFVTDRGTFTAELFENEAPNTVANFISLAEKGFFDNTKFTTLIPGYSIEGGDPMTRVGGMMGSGRNPGYRIPDEHGGEEARTHFSGTLSMNHGREADSGGSLFSICFRPAPERNGQYTAFGRIIDGLDVARGLQQNDTLESVKVLRKRDHEYKPETLPLTTSPARTGATPAAPGAAPGATPAAPGATPPASTPAKPEPEPESAPPGSP